MCGNKNNKLCSRDFVRPSLEASKGEIFLKKSSPILRETFRGMALLCCK